MKKSWVIVLILLAAAAGFYFFYLRPKNDSKVTFTTANVERGNIRSVVEATGTINAVTTVQVGSQVSGTISQLTADFNSKVRKGQVIAQIDPSIFEGNLLQARADLENARANHAAARANAEKAKSSAVQLKAEYERTQALAKEGVFSQQQLEVARANYEAAQSGVNAALAQVTQAAAQVTQRSAAVQVSQTNLAHTRIVAPIDGTVVNRSVDVGQTVAASLQAPTLFTIAQDLTKMQVYTKTDESDIGRIRPGQQVQFKVDAFPNEMFRGAVQQVRMNATVVQNVVTYDTIIEFENPELKLFPGMTAYVTIPVASAQNVLKIPNAVLRFKPDMKRDELLALYKKHNIEVGRGGGGGSEAAAEDNAGTPVANGEAAATRPRGKRGAEAGEGANGDPQRAREGGERTSGGARRNESVVVWKLSPEKELIPIKIRTGITDFTSTELVEGDVKEGDTLVTGSSSARSGGGRIGGPPGGQPPGRR